MRNNYVIYQVIYCLSLYFLSGVLLLFVAAKMIQATPRIAEKAHIFTIRDAINQIVHSKVTSYIEVFSAVGILFAEGIWLLIICTSLSLVVIAGFTSEFFLRPNRAIVLEA